MQMVKKILIALVLIWFAFIVLMPKQEIYYKLEKVLEKSEIKINEQKIDEGLFTLTLHNADIYVKGIKLATVEKVNFFTLLFYSNVNLDDLVLDDSLKSMAPTDIQNASASHIIVNPLSVSLSADGGFGSMDGYVKLADKTLRVDFNDSIGVKMLQPKLKQDEKGWYYETSF